MSGIDPTTLPGRAVDIVHAAATSCELGLWSIRVDFSYDGPSVTAHLAADTQREESAGRAIFARLGVTDPALERVPTHGHARIVAQVPVIGMRLNIVIDDLGPEPEVQDPAALAALVAKVDAARAAQAALDDDALAVTR